MSRFPTLLAAISLSHVADQMALAALPLCAVLALGAGPGLTGVLVAAQGAAWLLVSLPAGVVVDRGSKRGLIVGAQAAAALACAVAALAAWQGVGPLLGVASFVGAGGTVVLALAALALVPHLVPADALPKANARLELARAGAALAAPVLAGFLAARANPALGFAVGAVAAALAAVVAARLPDSAGQAAPTRPPVLRAIREGADFVLRHPLLRGIVLCAVFWNFAFFALLAVAVPFALERIGLDAAHTGLMQGGYGVGLILGALVAPGLLARVAPRVVLIAGPALSTLAAGLLWTAPRGGGFAAGAAAYFLIGFGPMLWLICQTSIRQLVTPAALLGRVAALIQVAIYGVRPLGALAGGTLAATAGLDAAVAMVIVCFALSALVPLVSALGQLRAMPAAAPA